MPLTTQEIEKLNATVIRLQQDPSLAHTSAQLAKLTDIPLLRFKQVFKEHMGTTVQHFLTNAKMMKAAEMLRHDLPIKQIGISIGYSDVTSFYRTFAKHYGCTPVQYRQRTQS